MIYRSRHIRYLVDPHNPEVPLITLGDHLTPAQGSDQRFPIVDEIYTFLEDDPSYDFDARCDAKGWSAPSVDEFMALPRKFLRSWGDYWVQRSLSMAAMWQVIEEVRHDDLRRCVGYQGVAAQISHGLPYIAYGLDLGGYATYAVSPHRGAYSLSVYDTGRYARVQADLMTLPLRPAAFDVVVYNAVDPAEDLSEPELDRLARCLKRGGLLILLDMPDAEARFKKPLRRHALRVETLDVRKMIDAPALRLRAMLSRGNDYPPMLVAKR